VRLMLDECFRHAKAIGAWGDGRAATSSVADASGVVVGDTAAEVLEEVQQLMAAHRVWDRFPTRM
jgi:catalase